MKDGTKDDHESAASTGSSGKSGKKQAGPPPGGMKGTVVFVGDGDTITVRPRHGKRGIIVRFFGIDCPELHQVYGEQAREFTAKLVEGKTVTLITADKGVYNRTIALVYLEDGRCLNELLVKAGLAWFHHPPIFPLPKGKLFRAFIKKFAGEMLEAKKAGRGLWSEEHPEAPWRYRRMRKHGKTTVYVTAHGRRYHRAHCKAIKHGADAVSLREARSRGLSPCRICKPDLEVEAGSWGYGFRGGRSSTSRYRHSYRRWIVDEDGISHGRHYDPEDADEDEPARDDARFDGMADDLGYDEY